jgi:hypothetical protein
MSLGGPSIPYAPAVGRLPRRHDLARFSQLTSGRMWMSRQLLPHSEAAGVILSGQTESGQTEFHGESVGCDLRPLRWELGASRSIRQRVCRIC